ncbi:MAG: NAD(P)H-dependent oxidoreductase subunit E [Clostridiales bacterium]|nr:NAD(P)H-dependent oxidoreductase subunit E [Clostridiales bacterium]
MKRLDPILEKYGNVKGSLVTILQKTQDVLGYLPEEALVYISARTGTALSKIYGVATFYTQFRLRPVGKYLLMLCMGTACHVNGAAEIEAAVTERLGIADGETTEDGLFTLNVVACLGCCSLAPVMMVRSQDGEEVYGNLTRASVQNLLSEIAAGAVAVDIVAGTGSAAAESAPTEEVGE